MTISRLSHLGDAYAPERGDDFAGHVSIHGDFHTPEAVREYAATLLALADFAEVQAGPIHVPASEIDTEGEGDHAACSGLPAATGGPDEVTCPECLEDFAYIFPRPVCEDCQTPETVRSRPRHHGDILCDSCDEGRTLDGYPIKDH